MKIKIISILLALSLLFNIFGLWKFSAGAGVFSTSELNAKLNVLKVQLQLAEENLAGAAATDNPIEFYAYVYRANNALVFATALADIMQLPVYQRYLVDISALGQSLFILERETAIVQGEMISREFRSVRKEDLNRLRSVAVNVQRIKTIIQDKSANRKDFKSIMSSL